MEEDDQTKSLEIMTYKEVEESKRKEDRKRRNRESAAKCRQKLKDKLNNCQKVVDLEEDRNKALKNEKSLVEIELKSVLIVLKHHKKHCKLHSNSYHPYNGFSGFKAWHTISSPNTSPIDINNNKVNDKTDHQI